MKRSIEKLRFEYGNMPLLERELQSDPVEQFLLWMDEALNAEVMEPNGMILATITATGRPSTRTVLLKEVSGGGFLFYTNYSSRKAEQLALHPYASLTFWWKEIYRQIHIEGAVKRVSRRETLAYFKKRPRGAQLAAHASHQSAPLATRAEIDSMFELQKKKYRGKPVPCPKEWGGYRVVPERIEFWQGLQNRLHDRFLYVKANGEWILSRLSP
ncbi:MAG: pyridoxamine 5'-phosphate oxidase [Chlamydiales bacterium]|nr:pyridoxamine 5'-phosphate oxidase [Chlamydiales bacterium]